MSHFRVSDHIIDHPQFINLPPRATVLWLFATAWCQRHLTDGKIPKYAMRSLPKYTSKTVQILLEIGLIFDRKTDYELAGFLKHNDSRDTTEKRRKHWADRKRRYRDQRNVPAGHAKNVPLGVPAQIRSVRTYKEHKYVAPAVRPVPRTPWFVECEELHGRTCIHRSHHELVMAKQRQEAS